MFHKDNTNQLVFVKSLYINAFPCGRRKGVFDKDGDNSTVNDIQYIPFDPEARLNTEANNRKYSSLNGFSQSYLKSWTKNTTGDTGTLSLVVGGYLFKITFTKNLAASAEYFGEAVALELSKNSPIDVLAITEIYANIKLAKVKLYSEANDIPETSTEVLRDQTTNQDAATALDLPIELDTNKKYDADNYYFSGLSFSANKPLKDATAYLKLLVKNTNGIWQINEEARLPEVSHGDLPDSVRVDTLQATNIYVDGELKLNGKPVVTLDVEQVPSSDKYRLKFTGATLPDELTLTD